MLSIILTTSVLFPEAMNETVMLSILASAVAGHVRARKKRRAERQLGKFYDSVVGLRLDSQQRPA